MSLRKILSLVLVVCLLAAQAVTVAYADEISLETETLKEASTDAETQLTEAIEEIIETNEEIEEETKAEETIEVESLEENQVAPINEEESRVDEQNTQEDTNTEVKDDILLESALEDVVITLKADRDAFKDVVGDLRLFVDLVSNDEVQSQVDEALKNEETENVAKRVTYDIKVYDDEKEQQPVKDVKVEFNLKDAPSGADKVNVFHHDENEGVEKIATQVLNDEAKKETISIGETALDKISEAVEITEEELEYLDYVEIEDDVTVKATTGGFSLYTVDFTYKDKTISIAGDSNHNKLDEITKQLGIDEKVEEVSTYQNAECEGNPTGGEVKNDEGKTLFSVYEIGDSWYVDAEKAFNTEHGLIVKTADGAEYKIKVTDANSVSYLYPEYKTANNPKSGIASWKTGTCNSYTSVTKDDSSWGSSGTEKWYVASGAITINNTVEINGDVNLILLDGCDLKITGTTGDDDGDYYGPGISVNGSNSLTIYAQSGGTGKLSATGGEQTYDGEGAAGIGGKYQEDGSNITINGGNITAKGTYESTAGIGGGGDGDGANITINWGTIVATGKDAGAGIGGGSNGEGKDIIINGGDVTATTDEEGAGIGGGYYGQGSNITINAGTVNASSGKYGAGIGGGCDGSALNININGGKVTATGGDGDVSFGAGDGIGGGGTSAGGQGTASNIKSALTIKAGANAGSATLISFVIGEDIASKITGKQYVETGNRITPTPPTPTPTPTPQGGGESTNKKTSSGSSSSSESWSCVPVSLGSSSSPINNGKWTNASGTYKYLVDGQSLKNTTAWITYIGSDGKTYSGRFYFDKYGNMLLGWQLIDNVWYYFDPTVGQTQGMMKVTGWVETDGKLYYLGVDGKMLTNTITPDGKKVGLDGARIK